MIPESVLYAAYAVFIAFGVAITVALVMGTYLIWQAVRTFRSLRKSDDGMKKFMQDGAVW